MSKPPTPVTMPSPEAPPTAVPKAEKAFVAGAVEAAKINVREFVRRVRGLPAEEQLKELANLDKSVALDDESNAERPVMSEQRRDDLATISAEAREYVERISEIRLRNSLEFVNKDILGTTILSEQGANAQNYAINKGVRERRKGKSVDDRRANLYGYTGSDTFWDGLYSNALNQNPQFKGFQSVEEVRGYIKKEAERVKATRDKKVNAENISGASDEDMRTMAQAAQRAKQIRDRVEAYQLGHEVDDVQIQAFIRDEPVMKSAGVNIAGLTIKEKGHEDASLGSELFDIATDPSRKPDMPAIKQHFETMSSVPIPEYPKQ